MLNPQTHAGFSWSTAWLSVPFPSNHSLNTVPWFLKGMNLKKTTKLDNVVFPDDVKLTCIDFDEVPVVRSKVDIQKILRQSIAKGL